MQEIIINVDKKEFKTIALVENGNLVEIQRQEKEDKRIEGNIYIGKVQNVLKGMQAAFVDIGENKNTFIHLKDILPKVDITKEKEENISEKDIGKVIKTGMPILVQVKRDSTDKKGARVSTHLSFSSRFFVLMPNTEIVTVSQKIQSEEKKKLIEMMKNKLPRQMGIIIRTSAKGKKEEELTEDLERLINRWKQVELAAEKAEEFPKLIEENMGITEKMIIDTFDSGMKRIITNNTKVQGEITEIIEKLGLSDKIKVDLQEKDTILDIYDLHSQIEKAENRKVWLKCGGFITIDKTEALTAIDVNSGKYIGKESLEQTVFRVNKEASIEIAKQIRLRDIGGIIIIDFIDMKLEKDREEIISVLEESLKTDRSKTQVLGFTKLNLVEMTRKHICSNE